MAALRRLLNMGCLIGAVCVWYCTGSSAMEEKGLGPPFYYIAPRFEGFGAKYLQLKNVYLNGVKRSNRPVVIVAGPNKWHHPDLSNAKISLCDILDFSNLHMSCTVDNPVNILQQNSCVVENCTENHWVCKPSAYLNTAKIIQLLLPLPASTFMLLEDEVDRFGGTPDRTARKEALLYSKEAFKHLGLKIVQKVDYTKEDCGFLYQYLPPEDNGPQVMFPVKVAVSLSPPSHCAFTVLPLHL